MANCKNDGSADCHSKLDPNNPDDVAFVRNYNSVWVSGFLAGYEQGAQNTLGELIRDVTKAADAGVIPFVQFTPDSITEFEEGLQKDLDGYRRLGDDIDPAAMIESYNHNCTAADLLAFLGDDDDDNESGA